MLENSFVFDAIEYLRNNETVAYSSLIENGCYKLREDTDDEADEDEDAVIYPLIKYRQLNRYRCGIAFESFGVFYRLPFPLGCLSAAVLSPLGIPGGELRL